MEIQRLIFSAILEATRFEKETGESLPNWQDRLEAYEQAGGLFVHFSNYPKISLFLRNKFSTPIGFYAYALDKAKINSFATERTHAIIFKPKPQAKILDLQSYTEQQLQADVLSLLRSGYNPSKIDQAGATAKNKTPGVRLWNITRILAGVDQPETDPLTLPERGGGPTGKWTMLLTNLGYDGVFDNGESIIGVEPSQAIFFNTTIVDVVDIIDKPVTIRDLHSRGGIVVPTVGESIKDTTISKFTFPKRGYVGTSFQNVRFSNLPLGATFRSCVLDNIQLPATFEEVSFRKCRFLNTLLEGKANAMGLLAFSECTFEMTDLSKTSVASVMASSSRFAKTNFKQTSFLNCSFSDNILNGCTFERCKFDTVSFTRDTIENCSFNKAVFLGCSFEQAEMVGNNSFKGASYDSYTKFPSGFNPEEAGMKLQGG
jgi:uncharacterized protein YjbI with pentapeptide repeats